MNPQLFPGGRTSQSAKLSPVSRLLVTTVSLISAYLSANRSRRHADCSSRRSLDLAGCPNLAHSTTLEAQSTTTMKQPRLPGTEKFKFSAPDKPISSGPVSSSKHRLSSWSTTDHPSSQPHFVFHSRTSSVSCPGELRPISSTLSVPVLSRSDSSRRRAVLPITCRKTSRMLTNTNAELNVDITPEDKSLDASRVPSCPNLETSSRSLNASKTSLDTYFRKMSLQNSTIRELPPDFDWKNIRAAPSRLSASCSSSCSSEENVWVLREDH